MIRRIAPLAALLALPALASCSVFQKKEPPPCPPIYVLGDASQMIKYKPGKGRDITDVEFKVEVQGYAGECTYDENGAIVEMQASFAVTRGPADDDRKAEFEYFLAIPYFYPSDQAKAVFPVKIDMLEGTNYMRFTDETVSLRIPVKDKDIINKYEIYIGLQTDAQQLEENRRTRR